MQSRMAERNGLTIYDATTLRSKMIGVHAVCCMMVLISWLLIYLMLIEMK